jgi:ectoine hydroxylase-related dioxygenase (phytanoyl-CoA dioxygenase family)
MTTLDPHYSGARPASPAAKGPLTQEQRRFWNQNGYLVMRDFLSPVDLESLIQWTEELEAWPETPGQWMKYFERPVGGSRQLCRVENFLPYHKPLSDFLLSEKNLGLLNELMGEPALIFKEKINFKLAGGKGFVAHQDAPAYTSFGHTYHITMMVSVDPTTVENGCLDVVNGFGRQETLPQETDLTIRKDIIESMKWEPLTTMPGDVVFFDSYLPHGSGPNRSQAPRRAYYITYNRKSEGDFRDQYYAQKRKDFPPECERDPNVDYSKRTSIFNLGNPID